MNPLSLLFRALDPVLRAFLRLRALPWRQLASTGLRRLTDRRWWYSVAERAWAPRHRRRLHITAAAVLGGVVIAAAATTAALHADHSTLTAGYGAAAHRRSDVAQHARARRAHVARPRYVARGSAWRLPVRAKHYWISSGFGKRWGVLHAGVDLAVPIGTPVHAAHSGRVSIAGRYGGYGNAVGIENGHGIATVYGHTSRVIVHDGQWVRAGQLIAFSGDTGDSTGPHLHFEMRLHGVPFNPLPYLRAHGLYLVRAAGQG